jgi:hypothetical protein
MKDLTDEELFDLANDYIKKNRKHAISSIILGLTGMIQSVFFIFDKINYIPFLIISIILYTFSYYHIKMSNLAIKKVEKILEEFDSRSNI